VERVHVVVRVLPELDAHGNIRVAYQVVGEPDVVEVVDLEHDVVQSLVGGADAPGDRVIAGVAVHEVELQRTSAGPELVLDAAAQPERLVEAHTGGGIPLAGDAVTQPTAAGDELAVHAAPGVEGLGEPYQRAVEDLDRVAVRVAELHHLEHATVLRLLQRADAKRNACFGELRLHRGELVRACDAEPEIRE